MVLKIYNRTILMLLYIISSFSILDLLTINVEDYSTYNLSISHNGQVQSLFEQDETEYMDVPQYLDTSFKSYMDYKTIDDDTSTQFYLQTMAYTDANGFRRIGDYYLVAVGTYYSEYCGKILEIGFSDGNVINAIVGDLKQDVHTNETNQYVEIVDGLVNIVEFIVDMDNLSLESRYMGDCSYSGFVGNVEYIKTENENYLTI